MSWGNNGGPWGSSGGGKKPSGGNPWNNPPPPQDRGPGQGGSGQEPPDFDALIREGQNKLRQMFPGGFNGGKAVLVVVGAIFLLWLASGFYQVNTAQLGVVMRFGEPIRVESAGLRYHLPAPIETVLLPDVTLVRKIEIGFRSGPDGRPQDEINVPDESIMLTGDENIIDVNFEVHWVVNPENVEDYLFIIRDPQKTVKATAESAMREVIGQTDIQTALTVGRQEIERKTHELLQNLLDQYQSGITVRQVNLRAARPPQEVTDAFQDVTRARSDKETAINQAETYKSRIIPEAEGQALRMIQEAEAYRQKVVNVTQGEAARFMDVYRSYSDSRDVTARRIYLETMESVLSGANKVVIDPQLKGVTPLLPLNEMIKPPPARTQPEQ